MVPLPCRVQFSATCKHLYHVSKQYARPWWSSRDFSVTIRTTVAFYNFFQFCRAFANIKPLIPKAALVLTPEPSAMRETWTVDLLLRTMATTFCHVRDLSLHLLYSPVSYDINKTIFSPWAALESIAFSNGNWTDLE